MRKILKILVPVLILFSLSFFGYKIYAKITQKQQIAQQIKTIPEFYFYQIDMVETYESTSLQNEHIYKNTDLQQNKATLIINFHPECEHCSYEAEIISKQIKDFEAYQLLFISYAETNEIKTFASKHKLTGYENITFLEDKDMVFDDIFGKSGVPASFIYNKNGKLVKQFKGEVKVESLLKSLEHE